VIVCHLLRHNTLAHARWLFLADAVTNHVPDYVTHHEPYHIPDRID
jgi:hypothetical protein